VGVDGGAGRRAGPGGRDPPGATASRRGEVSADGVGGFAF
jgi:hypothetical protein